KNSLKESQCFLEGSSFLQNAQRGGFRGPGQKRGRAGNQQKSIGQLPRCRNGVRTICQVDSSRLKCFPRGPQKGILQAVIRGKVRGGGCFVFLPEMIEDDPGAQFHTIVAPFLSVSLASVYKGPYCPLYTNVKLSKLYDGIFHNTR